MTKEKKKIIYVLRTESKDKVMLKYPDDIDLDYLGEPFVLLKCLVLEVTRGAGVK